MVLYFRDLLHKNRYQYLGLKHGLFSINLKGTFARQEKSLTSRCQSITLRTAGEFHF